MSSCFTVASNPNIPQHYPKSSEALQLRVSQQLQVHMVSENRRVLLLIIVSMYTRAPIPEFT